MKDVVKNQVKQLMQDSYICRNDDKVLLIKIWQQYGLELSADQIDRFKDAPSAETILRRRREFSSLYPANPVVTAHRHRQEAEYVAEYSDGSWFKKLLRRRGIS